MISPNRPLDRTRIEIQGLRAVAVLVVVLFHLFPKTLPGGYVGVDAFLTTSGFLITSHLLGEIENTGRVHLASFWARRARRLLPAAYVVLLCTVAGTFFLAVTPTWKAVAREIGASAAYVENFVLAKDARDYFASEAIATPVQHFWSLCVEEQFYLVWPLLIAAVARMLRTTPEKRHGGLLALGSVTLVASFLACVVTTKANQSTAYFSPWTRAWEFVAGALLAMGGWRLPGWVAPAIPRWIGFGTLILITCVQRDDSAFPGWLALLPTTAAALVLLPSTRAERPLDEAVLRLLKPIGDLSYSIYLWHWPLLVVPRLHLGRGLSTPELSLVFLLTLLLSALSKRFVEDPLRAPTNLLAGPPWRTLALSVAGMGTVLTGAYALHHRHHTLEQAAIERAKAAPSRRHKCFGANSPKHGPPCQGLEMFRELLPEPIAAKADHGADCMASQTARKMKLCERGYRKSRRLFALVGDSHAAHLLPGLEKAAERAKVKLIVMTKGSCPLNDQPRPHCQTWKEDVRKKLAELPIEKLIMANSHQRAFQAEKGLSPFEAGMQGFIAEWTDLPGHIQEVVVIRDIPRPIPTVIECLAGLPSIEAQLKPGACGRPISSALGRDPAAEAAQGLARPAAVLDLSDIFCGETTCDPVIGNALVFRDSHHMTATFSRSLWQRYMPLFK